MCYEGLGVLEISRILKMSKTTVEKYIMHFNHGGLDELLSYVKANGSPSKLNEEERHVCYDALQKAPKEADIGVSANWTSILMQDFIEKKFAKKLTPTGIQKILHRMGFSFTRPTYTLARADKKISEFEANFQITKDKVNNSTVILFEDESYIRDYQAICSTWFLKGQQRKVKTYGQHKGVGLFGFLDYQNGKVLCDVAEQLNAQNFQSFLENSVFPTYEDKKIIMILDSSKIHHAKSLEPFKEKNIYIIKALCQMLW